MFANRYTAFVDACSLAGVLKRNLLLTLAEAEFFRIRWSASVLAETQGAIERMLVAKGVENAGEQAARARQRLEEAFEEAMVADFDHLLGLCDDWPDPGDAHIVAAALTAGAATIVTDNLKHFPATRLRLFNIEARSTDDFIADTIALDTGRAVAAVRRMRERFQRPEKTAELLLIDMEAAGLTETADLLRPHIDSL